MQSIARLFLFIFLCGVVQSPACRSEIGEDDVADRIQRVENGLLFPIAIEGREPERFSIYERMRAHNVPGVSIAVIRDGKIEWAKGYGTTVNGESIPVTDNTLFQAASISKPVAALGAMLLYQEGRIDVDEDVNVYLERWRLPENRLTRVERVTVRRLLNHTAGVTVHGFPGYTVEEEIPTLIEILNGSANAKTGPVYVDFLPGSDWRYSGGGYCILQQLMTDVTGVEFDVLMEQLILKQLNMTSSTFSQPLPASLHHRAASAHDQNGVPILGNWHIYPEMAAAGLWTTPADLARLAIEVADAYHGKSRHGLRREIIQEMFARPLNNYGLGFQLNGRGSSLSFGHGGSNRGYQSRLFMYAHKGMGAVVMTNSDNGQPLIDEILRAISSVYGWDDFRQVKKSITPLDPSIFRRYEGEYRIRGVDSNVMITLYVENHRFMATLWDGTTIELFPETETRFFSTELPHVFEFEMITVSDVQRLYVHTPWGQKLPAERR